MKDKRGFTLIEILIVISIVAVVTISSLALVNKSMENSKERSLEQLYNKIELAAETYLNKNDYLLQNLYNTKEPICTKIYTLQNSSLLDFNIKNPITNERINGSLCVYTYLDDNGYVITSFRDDPVELSGGKTLANKILEDNNEQSDSSIDFSEVSSNTNGKGLYYTSTNTEGNKPVYYFRGNVDNNYVKFARTINSNTALWRIVRINEDGSVRLIFNEHFTSSSYFNNTSNNNDITYYSKQNILIYGCDNHPQCGGYMFGEKQHANTYESKIKSQVIDDWYEQTILKYKDESNYLYDSYISRTAIYCNDRSASTYTTSSEFWFDSYYRLTQDYKPQFMCENINDKFTVSNETGNGLLDYGMALLTADEVVYAGGMISKNNKDFYLYRNTNGNNEDNSYWYTMTPWRFRNNNGEFIINMYAVSAEGDTPGGLRGVGTHSSASTFVRPVLSLKSCVYVTGGDGSYDNPYVVEIDALCSIMPN